jgi:preprotein translocase subunit YajC
MSITTLALVAIIAGILYFFYRRLRATRKDEGIVIEKVKAGTYILCPRCGAHLQVEDQDE